MVPKLSVVLPAKNEAGNVGPLIQEVAESLRTLEYEIILVDDASNDDTVEEAIQIAKQYESKLVVVHHEKSEGQSTAIHTGVSFASGEWIITMDADGQNDPSDIPSMLQRAQNVTNPNFCIAGYRNKRKDTAWVRFQSRFANSLRQYLLSDGVPDTGCGLKVFPRATFLSMPYFDHMHRYVPALVSRLNGEIVVHPVNHRDRVAGISKYNVWNRALAGIVDMIGVMWLIRRAKHPKVSVSFRNTR